MSRNHHQRSLRTPHHRHRPAGRARRTSLVTDIHENKLASLQVKFSKDYLGTVTNPSVTPDIESGGWWTLNRNKIAASEADYWVMVLYQFHTRKFDFVVISPRDLLRCHEGIAGQAEIIQSYFWVTKRGRCWETRGLGRADLGKVCSGTYESQLRDFTRHLNNWRCLASPNLTSAQDWPAPSRRR